MIGWICFLLLSVGMICGVWFGQLDSVSRSLLSFPEESVTLVIKLAGTLCFFCGLMKVAQRAGLVDRFARILSRPLGRLIPKTRENLGVRSDVAMNLASNFFGLGNAATPFGIRGASGMVSQRISRSLATFMILNTCSVQLIPTTVCALRQANGADNPMDILPAVWIVQILSCVFGVILVRFVFREAK